MINFIESYEVKEKYSVITTIESLNYNKKNTNIYKIECFIIQSIYRLFKLEDEYPIFYKSLEFDSVNIYVTV